MSEKIQNQIAELQNQAADCELIASVSGDPDVRSINRTRAADLLRIAAALRPANPARRTPLGMTWTGR